MNTAVVPTSVLSFGEGITLALQGKAAVPHRTAQYRAKPLWLKPWLLALVAATLFMGLTAPVEAEFPDTLTTDSLNGRNGIRLFGSQDKDYFGASVAAGDVNGDGLPDVFVGAYRMNTSNGNGSGYVLFGSRAGFPASLIVTALNGSNGFRVDGAANGYSGASVSSGDFNGDGIDDLIIAPGWGYLTPAASGVNPPTYVVFGSRAGFPAVLPLASLDGTNGFAILCLLPGDPVGRLFNLRTSRAGDINGDGLEDVVIGDSGRVFVVYGRSAGFPATLSMAALDGTNGFTIDRGLIGPDLFGRAVGAAGDINGDGLDDLIIGAPNAPSAVGLGKAFVLFGKSTGFPAQVHMTDLDGSDGIALYGAGGSQMGYSVDGAGDVNGDGLDDVIIGNVEGESYETNANNGTAIVLFGRDQGFPTDANGNLNMQIELGSDRARRLSSTASNYQRLGESVSGAGDFNGDGVDDFLVGGVEYLPRAYIVFGKSGEFPAEMLAWTSIINGLHGDNGFILNASGGDGYLGSSVSEIGDFNGDGVDDVIVGAHASQYNTIPGSAAVLFGGLSGLGEVPVAGLSQASLDFGNVRLGQASPTQTITLQNTGYVHTLALGALTLSGPNTSDFALINNTCSNQTLAQDATCTFQIAMTPSAQGARDAQVDIPSNAPSGPNAVTLEGSGFVPPDGVFVNGFEGV